MAHVRIEEGQEYFSCGTIKLHDDYSVAYFGKRPKWLLNKNLYYEESMQDEFPNEHYKSWQNVPKYSIMKDRRPAGKFFPREAENGHKYLFCPKTRAIKSVYYIFDVDNNHNIKNNARITRPL